MTRADGIGDTGSKSVCRETGQENDDEEGFEKEKSQGFCVSLPLLEMMLMTVMVKSERGLPRGAIRITR